jgi:hypothetical protein
MKLFYYNREKFIGKMNRRAFILLPLIFGVLFMLHSCSYMKESAVIVDDEQIRITGVYGERIPINELNQVFLADIVPNITLRTNGISAGRINKGYFRSSSLRKNVKLLLHTRKAPYLYIIYGDSRYVILNFRDGEKTVEVYEKLKGLVKE